MTAANEDFVNYHFTSYCDSINYFLQQIGEGKGELIRILLPECGNCRKTNPQFRGVHQMIYDKINLYEILYCTKTCLELAEERLLNSGLIYFYFCAGSINEQ